MGGSKVGLLIALLATPLVPQRARACDPILCPQQVRPVDGHRDVPLNGQVRVYYTVHQDDGPPIAELHDADGGTVDVDAVVDPRDPDLRIWDWAVTLVPRTPLQAHAAYSVLARGSSSDGVHAVACDLVSNFQTSDGEDLSPLPYELAPTLTSTLSPADISCPVLAERVVHHVVGVRVSGAAGYRLWVDGQPWRTWFDPDFTASTPPPLTDRHCFQIRPLDVAGNETPSVPSVCTPDAPSGGGPGVPPSQRSSPGCGAAQEAVWATCGLLACLLQRRSRP